MSIAVILLQQLIIMVLLMAAGYLMFKGKKISLEGSRSLANILVYLCLPCVIIKGFLVEQTTQATIGLLISAVAAAVTLGAPCGSPGSFSRRTLWQISPALSPTRGFSAFR